MEGGRELQLHLPQCSIRYRGREATSLTALYATEGSRRDTSASLPAAYATEGGRRDTSPPSLTTYATEGGTPTYGTYESVGTVC